MEKIKYSVVVPIYKSEALLDRLLIALGELNARLDGYMEAVFVVDGSPDASFSKLKKNLPSLGYAAQLILLSRNFGAFSAIRQGLQDAAGQYFAVLAADLQEPPELILSFFTALEKGECDVAVGSRKKRADPLMQRMASNIFWAIYRKWVMKDIPAGGVDIFGCNQLFREQLLRLEEAHTSLIAQIFWLGYERKYFEYDRLARNTGKSSWSFNRKINYMLDSIFSFTDLPIKLLIFVGSAGCLFSIVLSAAVLISYWLGKINVPGYAATILVVLFFGALNLLGIGIVGNYGWRSYENTKRRPLTLISFKTTNDNQ